MEYDFSGWATKNDVLCTDGRTIKRDAFKHQDKKKIPLMWQHQHNNAENVLGHAILENRPEGVYAYGFFNDSDAGKAAKVMVEHGDVDSLSIFANGLKHNNKKDVLHGNIKELSLVLAGANEEAVIDYVAIAHGDGTYDELEDEAVIMMGLTFETDNELDLEHADNSGGTVADTATKEKTVQDVWDSLDEEQQNVVSYLVGELVAQQAGDTAQHGEDLEDDEETLSTEEFLAHVDTRIQEGMSTIMANVFEQTGSTTDKTATLSHSELNAIFTDAQRSGSLRDAVLAHAGEATYGIEDIDLLFPDAKSVDNLPQFLSRQVEWVQLVIDGTRHIPFSRVKSVVADITAEEARARGYIKGNLKKEEVIKLLRRKTEPTTIYKKQKLDRDDILDITDFDVVAFLKGEMRLMLNEEIARAVLIGDGRSSASEDKIDEERIRPIAKDDDLYAHKHTLPANISVASRIEEIIRARSHYRGSGQPVLFTTLPFITDMLLEKDKVGRRLYASLDALAAELMVSKIVPVEVMETEEEVVGIIVNLSDYTIGADKGGEVSMFDDFDIDYNQQKYLMETRISGALTKPKAAVVLLRTVGTPVTPTSPSFNGATNTITIPTVAGVDYLIDGDVVTGNKVITRDTEVEAVAKDGNTIPSGTTTSWYFNYSE